MKSHELIEDVLDVLTEVGNGTTDEDLREALNKLLKFRDTHLQEAIKVYEIAQELVEVFDDSEKYPWVDSEGLGDYYATKFKEVMK